MIDTISTRIAARMTGETYDHTVMDELAQTMLDRLCIRLGVQESNFPKLFYSVAVDATVKAWRRRYYEGISSENVSEMSTSFVEDVLSEYDDEIASYLEGLSTDDDEDTTGKLVVFL